MLPVGSSDTTRKRDGQSFPYGKAIGYSSIRSCSKWGLHSRKVANALVSSYLAFPPLLPSKTEAVYLCCTFLQVTLTGYYPAPCPMELGLSSPKPKFSSDCLTYSLVDNITVIEKMQIYF